MLARKNRGALTGSGREQLSNIARRAKSSVRKVKRALILCQADEGLNDQQISQALLVEAATVSWVRQRFVKEGLESALNERPRPGQRPKLDGKPEARLVAVARSHAPAGHPRYTLRLLADKVVELEFADSASPEMVPRSLASELKAWQKKEWCISEVCAEFMAHMEGCTGPVPGTLRPPALQGLLVYEVTLGRCPSPVMAAWLEIMDAWVRLRAPSLSMMRVTCFLVVSWEIPSAWPIS
jgi:transposase